LVTSYTYDDLDRVTSIARPEGVSRFTYDVVGRTIEISEPGSTLSYTYDVLDRLLREVQSTDATRTEVTYGYDKLGRRTSRTVSGVLGETTTYEYDRANRLTSIGYRGETTTFEYDPAGRLIAKTLPNGIRQELSYDDANRLMAIVYKNSDDTIVDAISYGYDINGRRISRTSSRSTLIDTPSTAVYDAANRMTSLTLTGTDQTFDLTYDENGNLTGKIEADAPANLTRYSWDSRNRLTGISGPGLEATFIYDALDRRLAKVVNGQRVDYIYDGLQAVGEVTGGDAIGLLTGFGLDEVIARYSVVGGRYYLTEALNTVIAQIRADGSVLNLYSYSPYGEVNVLGSDDSNTIQYTARENDGTGLYFHRARYYDPILQRWMSEDPLGFVAGPNPYGFLLGDPVNYADPLGLFGLADLPAIPQEVVDFSAGLGDALLLGFGDELRDLTGAGGVVNQCSDAYRYGGYAALAAGVGRLGYAALAKGYSILASSGAAASAFRSQLRNIFRFGLGKAWRQPDLSKYGTDAALRAAAGRTNPYVNAYGAGVAIAGAANACGCPE
jgi:RHS repeat-associated protein